LTYEELLSLYVVDDRDEVKTSTISEAWVKIAGIKEATLPDGTFREINYPDGKRRIWDSPEKNKLIEEVDIVDGKKE